MNTSIDRWVALKSNLLHNKVQMDWLRPWMTMKTLLRLLFLLEAMSLTLQAASRDAQWKAVDEAINKGLPRTAITNLDLILPAALKEKAYGEAAKAIARKIVLEG